MPFDLQLYIISTLLIHFRHCVFVSAIYSKSMAEARTEDGVGNLSRLALAVGLEVVGRQAIADVGGMRCT
jgi:hypothetical protein